MNKRLISALTGTVVALGILFGAMGTVSASISAISWIAKGSPVHKSVYNSGLSRCWFANEENDLRSILEARIELGE